MASFRIPTPSPELEGICASEVSSSFNHGVPMVNDDIGDPMSFEESSPTKWASGMRGGWWLFVNCKRNVTLHGVSIQPTYNFSNLRLAISCGNLAFSGGISLGFPLFQEPLASKCGALFWFCGPSPSSPALVSAEMAQCAVLEPQEEWTKAKGSMGVVVDTLYLFTTFFLNNGMFWYISFRWLPSLKLTSHLKKNVLVSFGMACFQGLCLFQRGYIYI